MLTTRALSVRRRSSRRIFAKRCGRLDNVEFFAESLDIVRFPELEQQNVVADFFRERYADRRIDAALAIGPASLAFLAERRDGALPGYPDRLRGGEGDRRAPDLENSTGVIGTFDLGGSVDLAFAASAGRAPLGRDFGGGGARPELEGRREEALEAHRSRLEITYLAGLPIAKVLEEVGRLPRETIVVFLTMRQDGAGRALRGRPSDRARNRGSSAAPCTESTKVLGPRRRRGLCRALFRDRGSMAALTLRILRGEKAYDLTPVGSTKSCRRRTGRRCAVESRRARLPAGHQRVVARTDTLDAVPARS